MAVHIKREGFILENEGKMLSDVYEVETKKLGQGTYGSVSKAINRATHVVRAVKKISKAQLKNIARFRQEIAIMKQLDHPNIIKLCETFEDAKNIYLILELCTGGELFDRIIDEGYFTEKGAALLMKQIVAAIYYCHKHSIMHRDLKPENFLFLNKTPESPLKIIDFGLAAKFEEGSFMKTKAGTPYYVAPQVLQGKYDKACDIWSCGVIMYILLCGYPPFYGDSDGEILGKVKSGKFSFPEADWKQVSGDAKDLIKKMLTFDPSQRINAEAALNHAWIQSLAQMAVGDERVQKNIVSSLRTFRANCRLKKVALTVIAQQVAETDIDNLKKTFLGLDKNGDGTLTVQEIREGMAQTGIKIPPDLEELMKDIDSDGSGSIDYTEFIAATVDKKIYIQEDVCWSAFRIFDLDGNGRITHQELEKVLSSENVKEAMGAQAISEMIKEVDLNGDGEIDFDEFLAMMRGRGNGAGSVANA